MSEPKRLSVDGHLAELVWEFESPWTPRSVRVRMLDGPFAGLQLDVEAEALDSSLGVDVPGANGEAPEAEPTTYEKG